MALCSYNSANFPVELRRVTGRGTLHGNLFRQMTGMKDNRVRTLVILALAVSLGSACASTQNKQHAAPRAEANDLDNKPASPRSGANRAALDGAETPPGTAAPSDGEQNGPAAAPAARIGNEEDDARPPQLKVRVHMVQGGLGDPQVIAKHMDGEHDRLYACVSLEGDIVKEDIAVALRIRPNGRVARARITSARPAETACLVRVFESMRFAATRRKSFIKATVQRVDSTTAAANLGALTYGFGTGGIGAGYGKIGVSRIGGVGHGSGHGSGISRLVGPTSKTAHVQLGPVTVHGALDQKLVRRVLRTRLPQLRTCYQRELATRPALGGTMKVEFTVTEAAASGPGRVPGSVATARAWGVHSALDSCVATAMKGLRFPPPAGTQVLVNYSLTLSPRVP